MNYYEILGLTSDASDEDIKKSYRKLAMKYHPDRNPGDSASEAKFKEINEAYSTLSDPEKKKRYDYEQTYSQGFSHNNKSSAAPDVDDFVRNFFHQGSPFADIFGAGHSARMPVTYQVSLGFWEAIFGVNKRFEFTGTKNQNIQKRWAEVSFPPATNDGDSFLVEIDGAEVILQVRVGNDENFMRDNLDLHTHVSIPFTTAALGGSFIFPHWEGDIEVSVPAGTQPGQRLLLANKGIRKDMFIGDLYLRCHITVPKKLNKRQIEILREFEATEKNEKNTVLESLRNIWDKFFKK